MEKFNYYSFILCGICIVFFILQLFVSGFTDALLLNGSSWLQPWRFLTSIFLHGDVAHILYNLFALALFGSMLERLVGSRKFLFIFLTTGVVANLISVNFYPSSLGASGAIFGIIGALIFIRPNLVVFAFGLPMPIFIAGILWAIGDLIGIFVPSNVGNIAHLSGLGLGLIFGALFRDWSRRPTKDRITINEHEIRNWEDRYLR